MGLILAAAAATMSTLSDQYKEFYAAPAMDNSTLACIGKRHKDKWSTNKGNTNIISNGSVISVGGGQVMMIVDQGEVVEMVDTPGAFIYDTSSESSIFSGHLSQSLKDMLKTIGKRISFGGDSARDQRIVYINTMEVKGNTFGGKFTYKIQDSEVGFVMTGHLRCSGMFSFRICNPVLFVQNVCRLTFDSEFTSSALVPTLESEFKNTLNAAFSELSAQGVQYDQIAGKTFELTCKMNEQLSPEWREKRGIEIVSISFNNILLPDDELEKLQQGQAANQYIQPGMAAAATMAANNAAKLNASKNEGTVGAYFGMNAMQNASNEGDLIALIRMEEQQKAARAAQETAANANTWKCSCGASNTNKFCSECGKEKPAPANSWSCECGASNTGKFCSECGKQKPAPVSYCCNKCGWKPAEGATAPKFCPECGDPFDANDIVS